MNDRQRAVCAWAKERMDARDWVAIDTETTGLDDRAEIVSIAVVNAWGRVAFSSLVRPEFPIDEAGKAFEVNGISNAMVEYAPRWSAVWPIALDYLVNVRPVAYNKDFDCQMIAQNCSRQSGGKASLYPFREFWDCAMLKYAEYQGSPGRRPGDWKWHSLKNACEDLGIVSRGWHDAAGDALACWEIVAKLAERCEE